MARHSAKIVLSGGTGGVVEVDGVKLGGVTGIELVHSAVGMVPRLKVDFVLLAGSDVELANVEVVVPDKTRDSLIALGWTPPDGA